MKVYLATFYSSDLSRSAKRFLDQAKSMNIYDSINIFSEKDSEMDSEMSSCCCFVLRLLFGQKTARARGGCQGASGFVHSSSFAVGGYPFFEAIFNTKVHYPRCIITLNLNN